jgi:hypothetical protein
VNVAGEVQFGAMPLAGLPEREIAVPDAMLDGLIARDLRTRSFQEEGLDLRFVPLANEPRCHECHEPETGPMRGALVVAVRRLPGDDLVEATLDRSLRSIMLSGLGRLVIEYLESARTAAHLETLALHDPFGRLYHDAGKPSHPPPAVRSACPPCAARSRRPRTSAPARTSVTSRCRRSRTTASASGATGPTTTSVAWSRS